MARKKSWVVLAIALVCWSVYFYLIDLAIMEGQDLPVLWTLMPK